MLNDRETGSIWQHCEPICYDGELDGTVLQEVGHQLHTVWGKWREWHPDTLVMGETNDPKHRDHRHGHGREEYFERRGIGWLEHQYFLGSMQTPPDERLPEQEAVLGVNEPEGVRAYPFRQVKHNGNVVNDDLNGLPVTVWSDPDPNMFTTVAYDPRVEDQLLEFELLNGEFVDKQTHSTWHLEGYAKSGPLKETVLRQLRGYFLRWHAWAAPRPATDIYFTSLKTPEESRWGVEEGVFRPLLDALRERTGLDVKIEEEITGFALPQGAERGIEIRLDSHRFWLYHASSIQHAKDLEVLPHDWETPPHCMAHGRFVLKDEPDEQWVDWTHVVRLQDNRIEWSPLLKDDKFIQVFRVACDEAEQAVAQSEPSFIQIIEELESRIEEQGHYLEYDYWNALVVSGQSRPPSCDFVLQFLLDVDRVLLYRFDSSEIAQEYAEKWGHALTAENYVLRSTPMDMYMIAKFEAGQMPDDKVNWAKALDDEDFCGSFKQVITGLKEQFEQST